MRLWVKKYRLLGFFTFCWLGFFLAGYLRLDPDFGWHWRMGQLILEKGIVYHDQLSYTMPSYPFVDFHWLSNVLMYLGYAHFGMGFLAGLFALFATGAIFVMGRGRSIYWFLFCGILAFTILLPRSGVRPQVFSWFFFSLVWVGFTNLRLWTRFRWFFPFLMMMWANLHGGFFLGLAVVGSGLGYDLVVRRQYRLIDWAIWVGGVLGTLLNPFGVHLWKAVFLLLSDPLTKANVSEWKPFFSSIELSLFFPVPLFLVFGKSLWKKYTFEFIIVGLLFLSSLSSIRNAAFFVLISIPVLGLVLEESFDQLSALGSLAKIRIRYLQKILWIMLGFLVGIVVLMFAIDSYLGNGSETESYPVGAVAYLRSHPLPGNMFTVYHWAGYFEWKLPERKQFIDGRMPEWRVTPLGYLGTEGESDHPLSDYFAITRDGKEQPYFDMYDVNIVVWPTFSSKQDIRNRLVLSIRGLFGMPSNIDQPIFPQALSPEKWNKVYQDEVFVIYQKQ